MTSGLAGAEAAIRQVESDELSNHSRDTDRIHYFDWLRALAVLGVVIYHALQPFGSVNWFIRNPELSPVVTNLVSVLGSFGMPVLFLIAGASARFALQRHPAGVFLAERAQRLLVPFVVGTIVLSPIVGYVIGLFNGTVSGSFLGYVLAYPGIVFDYNLHYVGLSMRLLLVGVHLWFLGALFIFSAIGLPLFTFLRSTRGRAVLNWLSSVARFPGATLLLAVPMTLPILVLFASTTQPELWDSWSFAWFAVVFLAGYVIYSDERLVAAARRDFAAAAIVSVLGIAGLAATNFASWVALPQQYGPTYFGMLSLYGVTGWSCTLALLGLGMRLPVLSRPLPRGIGETALPLYVLHMPIVVAISAIVVHSDVDLLPKMIVNLALGVGLSLAVAVMATRARFVRPLLGLRPVTRRSTPAMGPVPSAAG